MSTASFLGRLERSLAPHPLPLSLSRLLLLFYLLVLFLFILARGGCRGRVSCAHFQWPCIINLIARSQSNCRLELFSWLSVLPEWQLLSFLMWPSTLYPHSHPSRMHWKPKKLPRAPARIVIVAYATWATPQPSPSHPFRLVWPARFPGTGVRALPVTCWAT